MSPSTSTRARPACPRGARGSTSGGGPAWPRSARPARPPAPPWRPSLRPLPLAHARLALEVLAAPRRGAGQQGLAVPARRARPPGHGRGPPHRLQGEVIATHLVPHHHVERCRGGAFLVEP